MNQSNRQSSLDNFSHNKLDDDSNDDDDDKDTATIQVTREPFWAFVPNISNWAIRLVSDESQAAHQAIVGFPSWSHAYLEDTANFYRNNPKILANEVRTQLQELTIQGYLLIFLFLCVVDPFGIDRSHHASKCPFKLLLLSAFQRSGMQAFSFVFDFRIMTLSP